MNPLNVLDVVLAQRGDDAAAAGILAAMAGLWLVFALIGLASMAFFLFCWWRIFEKAGFAGAFAFLFLVPGFGPLIVVLLLAFGEWPALKQRA